MLTDVKKSEGGRGMATFLTGLTIQQTCKPNRPDHPTDVQTKQLDKAESG